MPRTEPDAAAARRILRAHLEGSLLFDGRITRVRYVVDGRTGGLTFPVEPFVLKASEHTLFIPEERDDALQLLLSIAPADGESDEACDRWAAYHGKDESRRWAKATIESGKLGDAVFDGPELMRENPLRAAEPRLLKGLNADRHVLSEICRAALNHLWQVHEDAPAGAAPPGAAPPPGAGVPPPGTGPRVDGPLAVGIDEGGLDVRARFGVARIEFTEPAATPEAAQREIARLDAVVREADRG